VQSSFLASMDRSFLGFLGDALVCTKRLGDLVFNGSWLKVLSVWLHAKGLVRWRAECNLSTPCSHVTTAETNGPYRNQLGARIDPGASGFLLELRRIPAQASRA
jgi:hypothetical protein